MLFKLLTWTNQKIFLLHFWIKQFFSFVSRLPSYHEVCRHSVPFKPLVNPVCPTIQFSYWPFCQQHAKKKIDDSCHMFLTKIKFIKNVFI